MHEVSALGLGLVVGFLFAILRLPIPAPPTLAGLLGIIGITLGFFIVSKIIG